MLKAGQDEYCHRKENRTIPAGRTVKRLKAAHAQIHQHAAEQRQHEQAGQGVGHFGSAQLGCALHQPVRRPRLPQQQRDTQRTRKVACERQQQLHGVGHAVSAQPADLAGEQPQPHGNDKKQPDAEKTGSEHPVFDG